MLNNRFVISLLILGICFYACEDKEEIREISAFRTISIPVQWVDETEPVPEKLTLRRGGEDELPQGPTSFDVITDGSFVIADPLLRRIVRYDSLGQFMADTDVGMRISRVRMETDGDLYLKNFSTATEYMLTEDAGIMPVDTSLKSRDIDSGHQVKISGRDRGTILRQGMRSLEDNAIDVRFESDSTQMIAMQYLGADEENNPVVALETTGGDATIDIIKIIRKYGSDGTPLCQFRDISADYFVYPEDAFRVHGDYVYQFVPRETDVMIKVWDTSQCETNK
jgi:hypothetical protein